LRPYPKQETISRGPKSRAMLMAKPVSHPKHAAMPMKTKASINGVRFFEPNLSALNAKIQNISTAEAKNSEKNAPVVDMKGAGEVAKMPEVLWLENPVIVRILAPPS